MKISFLLFFVILISSCQSSRLNKSLSTLEETNKIKLENCLENGSCTIEIIPNSILTLKEDEFKNAYVEIEKGKNTVIKYQFKKDEVPNTSDSQYLEMVFFETDNYDKKIQLENEKLQEVKMVFGRLCYCKGTSGYFGVNKGSLELTIKKNKLTLDASFIIENIPHLITEINESIVLE